MSGQVLFGDAYYPRPKDEARIWRKIKTGSNLLLLAPRRVGKTSLLRKLEAEPEEGYTFLYVMVQSCTTQGEYYLQILDNLYKSKLFSKPAKIANNGKKFIQDILGNVERIELGEAGLKLKNNSKELGYQDLITILTSLKLEEKLIIVLDEYPDVIEAINQKSGPEAAISFLKNTRSLCQNTQNIEIQFIFTGSIGLDTVVSRLGESNLINDLDSATIKPMKHDDALKFIQFLAKKNESSIKLSGEIAKHLLDKVEWLMPYYIEILWDCLEELCIEEEIDDPQIRHVDNAFEELFSQNYKQYFNHWVERLKRFNEKERMLAKDILNLMSKVGEIEQSTMVNITIDKRYKEVNGSYIIHCLLHDGYIFEPEPNYYKFTTPILKEWWCRYANK